MHTEYFLLTADVTVQVPVTLIVPAQTCGKSRPVPVQNPSQVETGFDGFCRRWSQQRGGKRCKYRLRA